MDLDLLMECRWMRHETGRSLCSTDTDDRPSHRNYPKVAQEWTLDLTPRRNVNQLVTW